MIIQAIQNLAPNANWSMSDGNYDEIVWMSHDIEKPSKDAVFAEIARLQAEYNAKEYQRLRAAEYPSFADQFDTIFHQGLDAWKAQIQAVKDKYPKGV